MLLNQWDFTLLSSPLALCLASPSASALGAGSYTFHTPLSHSPTEIPTRKHLHGDCVGYSPLDKAFCGRAPRQPYTKLWLVFRSHATLRIISTHSDENWHVFETFLKFSQTSSPRPPIDFFRLYLADKKDLAGFTPSPHELPLWKSPRYPHAIPTPNSP